ncbi:MAG: FAD-dependent oxidoreductase, partial [Dolichospermum sp.]
IYMLFQDENNQEKALLFDYLCFRLGFTPNVEELVRLFEKGGVGSVKLTEKGYIATDQFLRTSIPNIYAVGDVTNPRDACVATAVAHGTIAARSIEEDLRLSCYEKSL